MQFKFIESTIIKPKLSIYLGLYVLVQENKLLNSSFFGIFCLLINTIKIPKAKALFLTYSITFVDIKTTIKTLVP